MVKVTADIRRIRASNGMRHEDSELGAAPMNPLSQPRGEVRERGLRFRSNCMRKTRL